MINCEVNKNEFMNQYKLYVTLLLFFGLSKWGNSQITSNLPLVFITSSSPIGTSQMQGGISIIDNASGINVETDPPTYTGMIGVDIRGAATATKPTYNVETWSAPTISNDVSLLGLPAENDWVLSSSYYDRSFIRTMLSMQLHESMGRYAPRFKPCELFINNAYQGIYLFGEKIKRDTARLDLANLKNIDNSGYELTGGYIWTIDNGAANWTSQYAPPYATTQTIKFQYDHPSNGDITPAQGFYIKAYCDSFENAMNSSNFQDTLVGWRNFGAVNAFIDYMLINEVSKNYEAYRTNVYMYKDKGKKLRPGPLWGFDLAWKNTASCNSSLDTGYAFNLGGVCGTESKLAPFWWSKLQSDTAFMRELKCMYKDYRQVGNILDTNQIFKIIDSLSTQLNANGAITRNFTQWPIWGVPLNNEPTPMATNHAQEIASMKAFIKARLTWLDSQWAITNCPAPLAVNDLDLNNGLAIFPNPTTSVLNINFSGKKLSKMQATLTDIQGKKLLVAISSMNQLELDLSKFSSGVYFVTVSANDQKVTRKIVKQ